MIFQLKILLGDVAAAGNCQAAVDNESLVVHPAINPLEVEQQVPCPGAVAREGIEQAYFDIRVGVHQREIRVHTRRKNVINQQADTYPPIRGP